MKIKQHFYPLSSLPIPPNKKFNNGDRIIILRDRLDIRAGTVGIVTNIDYDHFSKIHIYVVNFDDTIKNY